MSIELVVGLGNPGQRYARTRHNVGYRVVEELAKRHADSRWMRAKHCEVASTRLSPRLILAKPLTFMNRSGLAVGWLLGLMEITPSDILVAVDDVELPLGSLRLRPSGGPGTHNGLRDICTKIGEEFPRLRIGVRGSEAWNDLAAYVTSHFTDAEEQRIPEVIHRAADAVEAVLRHGIDRAMSDFNRRLDETS